MSAAAAYPDSQAISGVPIAQLIFLGTVPQEEVKRLLDPAARSITAAQGEELFAQDTPVSYMYVLLEGRVRMERRVQTSSGERGRVLRCEVGSGALLGHHELLFRRPYMTTAVCTEPCRLMAIEAGGMSRLLYQFPAARAKMVNMRIIERLRLLPLFRRFDKAVLSYLSAVCDADPIELPAGHEFYAEGDTVDTLYLLDVGHVKLAWDEGYLAWLGNGGLFGVAFSQDGEPAGEASFVARHRAVALGPTITIRIKRKHFVEMTGLNPDRQGRAQLELREGVVLGLPIFRELKVTQRRKLSGYMSHYYIPTNHLLMQQGELADSLWVLLPGSRARVHALNPDGSALLSTDVIGPTYFSEAALDSPLPVDSTLEADAGSEWLRLHRRDFDAFALEEGDPNLGRLLFRGAAEAAGAAGKGGENDDASYRWMEPGEIIQDRRRRHWLELLPKCWFGLLVYGLLLALVLLGWLRADSPAVVLWIAGTLAVVGLAQLIWGVADYLNDFLVVTNRRLVRQEKVIFFRELRQEAALEQVQSVDISRDFLGNLFRYGDLKIQTAAEQGKILFDLVPEPEGMKSSILRAQETRRRHRTASGKNEIRRLLESRLGRRLTLPERVHGGKPVVPPAPAPSTWRERFFGGLHPFQRLHLQRQVGSRMIWRKHWAVLLGKAATPLTVLVLLLAVAAAPVLAPRQLENIIASYELVVLFFAFLSFCWLWWEVEDWRNDTYEVDDTQVVDSEKRPLALSSTRRTAFLNQIENVELSVPSPLHYLLNFGNVRLQTAATDGDFSFNWVPDPHGVAAEIQRRIEAFRVNEERRRAQQRAEELPDWFEMYNRVDEEANPLEGGRPRAATSRS